MLTETLNYGTSFAYDFTPELLSVSDWNKLLRAAAVAGSSQHRFRIGCVAVKSGRTLGFGTNEYKSHPRVPPARMSVHAEMYALNRLPNPSGVTLYIARLDKHDRLCLAKPCLYCVDRMLELGVSRVVYSDDSNSASGFRLKTVSSELLT